jgi:hypothetical protein
MFSIRWYAFTVGWVSLSTPSAMTDQAAQADQALEVKVADPAPTPSQELHRPEMPSWMGKVLRVRPPALPQLVGSGR